MKMIEGIDYPVWMNEEGLKTLQRQHLLDNETPREMYVRISESLADRLSEMLMLNTDWSIEEIVDFVKNTKEKWFEYMWSGWLCPSTPILSNLGTNRGYNISCYILRVADSLDSIYDKLHEMAMLTKMGGGVGITFDKVRGRGEAISTGGFTEGIIPFLKVYDSGIIAASQGSVRRGSASINLPIRHKDIREFLKMRLPIGDVNRQCLNLNNCVTIDDYFYDSLMKGDEQAREIWAELLSSRMKSGQPYIFNYHNVNKNKPEDFKKRNLKIDGTNICCLGGDTEVVTKEGIFPIRDLVGKTVTVFDGENWVECNNFRNFGHEPCWRITLNNGTFIDATSNHRWFVYNNFVDDESLEFDEKFTYQLNIGDELQTKPELNKRLTIESIVKNRHCDAVFCPTIPTTGKFLLANGILTGNSEIMLPHDPDHTVVCDLASLNLAKYPEWKDDKDFINFSLLFLDVNLQEFIETAKLNPAFANAVRFAEKSRAIGLGVLGWHTLLQAKSIPFNSIAARGLIRQIMSKVQREGQVYNKKWGGILGNPEWCDENRNSTLFAIAPTTTNSLVSGGVSQGIEPIVCNAWVQKSAKGTFIRKNRTFQKLIEKKYREHNTDQFWNSIMVDYKGSVQHLDFLTDDEKEVFLTAYEINQLELIKNAAIWQEYVDQGISLNLFFPADVDPKWLNKVHLTAWEVGIKALYYVRTESILSRDMKGSTFTDCLYCQ